MEVLVLVDFESTVGDELSLKMGDVVKNVTKSTEEGWLQGELRGMKGIFPANFAQEVPANLRGDSKREPRSVRQTKRIKQPRRCEVIYPYSPMNKDELELCVGETIEIMSEIEDGWWMGSKNGRLGAFPSNFVKEIFILSKDSKINEGKSRPKLSDAVFTKQFSQRTSVRNKAKNVEYCQVMFDYKPIAEDELELKKGEMVVILSKDSQDEGWWQGELNGRCGFFPDNFVMLIPPVSSLQTGDTSKPPARINSTKLPVKPDAPAMEKGSAVKAKDDKTEPKDLRSNPPSKVKLPIIIKPPAVKDKPNKVLPKTNVESPPASPKQAEEKENDQFDGVDVQTEKLSHPTANRAKPPQRRPPGHVPAAQETELESTPKKIQSDNCPRLQKPTEPVPTSKPEQSSKTPPPLRPVPPKVVVDGKTAPSKDKPTVQSLQAEIQELKMALELLQTQYKHDMQEVKEELRQEKNKRMTLQEEVHGLNMKK